MRRIAFIVFLFLIAAAPVFATEPTAKATKTPSPYNVPKADSAGEIDPVWLGQDATHRFATDAEKTTWNAKQSALTAGVDYLAPNGSGASLTGITASQIGGLDATHRWLTDAYISTWDAKQNALTVGVDYLAPAGSGANLTGITASQIGGLDATHRWLTDAYISAWNAKVGTSDVQALTNKDLTGAGNTFPTFNQDTTGSAVYWKTSGTGKASIVGPAVGATRSYTFPDADSTVLYSGGALGTPASGTLTNCTFPAISSGSVSATTSAQFAGVISDETGTGLVALADGAATTPIVTGTFASPITTNPYTVTASKNAILFYGATGTINLPAATAGMNLLIYNTGSFTITIDPNGSDVVVRDGTAQTGGVSFTLSSGAGNFVTLISDAANHWVTLGYKGTLAQGS